MGWFNRKGPETPKSPELQSAQVQPEAETPMSPESPLDAKLAKLEEVNTQRNALARLEEEVGELGQITIGAPETVIAQKKVEINDLSQRIQEEEKALQVLLPEATITVEEGRTVAIIDGKKYTGPKTSTAPIRIAGAEPDESGVELASGDIPRENINLATTPANRRVVPDAQEAKVGQIVSAEKTYNIDAVKPTQNPVIPDTTVEGQTVYEVK
ncbi:MAG: hypothetical protein ACD_83C00066G0002 [uncultured bacterium]|nr:MAG: hypothetical protein ACD_83C00066G0002 [uncultured bacterium]